MRILSSEGNLYVLNYFLGDHSIKFFFSTTNKPQKYCNFKIVQNQYHSTQ